MPECDDRFSAEWILAWGILELCCLGAASWNLYVCSYSDIQNAKGQKKDIASSGRMAYDDVSCEYCMGVFQGVFTY